MKSKTFKIACASLLIGAAVAFGAYFGSAPNSASGSTHAAKSPVPVTAAKVQQHDVPIVLEGLGTVTPLNTATIRSQVQGTLESVDFVEGQEVKRGDVLAKIDPRVYEAQVDQAEAALARDQASLKNAKTDLARTQPLADRGIATQQLLDKQNSQVAQGEGTVALDRAAQESAQTQLSFTTIAAPFDGVTGIRRIDPGNIVQPSDANGLVVLTQLQPIAIIFTLPSGDIPSLQQALASGEASVECKTWHVERRACPEAFVDATGHHRNDDGRDGQIDPEDPLPREALRNRAAHHRSGDERDSGGTAEDAQCLAALFPRERRAQERHREWHHQGRAGSLDGARGDQPADAARQRTGG
jgi:multidrug efflux pump subunit AcrA (membrane-fusion protein)